MDGWSVELGNGTKGKGELHLRLLIIKLPLLFAAAAAAFAAAAKRNPSNLFRGNRRCAAAATYVSAAAAAAALLPCPNPHPSLPPSARWAAVLLSMFSRSRPPAPPPRAAALPFAD